MTYYDLGWEEDLREKPCGRLIMIAESELSTASRRVLEPLLKTLRSEGDVTMVSGLSRACMFEAHRAASAEDRRFFYNRGDYLTPDEAISFLPWKEIWLVAQGRVWQLAPTC